MHTQLVCSYVLRFVCARVYVSWRRVLIGSAAVCLSLLTGFGRCVLVCAVVDGSGLFVVVLVFLPCHIDVLHHEHLRCYHLGLIDNTTPQTSHAYNTTQGVSVRARACVCARWCYVCACVRVCVWACVGKCAHACATKVWSLFLCLCVYV